MTKIKKRAILSAVLLLGLIVAAVIVLRFAFKPLDRSVTGEGFTTVTAATDSILAKLDDSHFEIEGTPELSPLFAV